MTPQTTQELIDAIKNDPQGTILILDYDGSHAPFVRNADEATMYPGLKEKIYALGEKGFTTAFSSGREINNLTKIVDMPTIKHYAGSHGNQITIGEEKKSHLPSESEMKYLQQIYKHNITDHIKPGFPYAIEEKPASIVLHWREYCEEQGIRGAALERFEQSLFEQHIEPVIDKYNKQAEPKYHLKVKNHGMNADISLISARNKGDALHDLITTFGRHDKPIYRNIITVSDSATDGDMIREADEVAKNYDMNTFNIIVEQASTPQWMLDRQAPDIVLRSDREQDPNLRLGGIPLLANVYDQLLR